MIKYNTLKIEGDKLLIEIEVEDKPYYDRISIEGVRVDTPLTYGTDTPYYIYDEDDVTTYSTEVPISNVKDELLIITPQVYVALPPDTPCGADVVDMAAIYNKSVLLDKGMVYLKELGNTCEISKDFVDFILKRYALDMAIATCNYTTAIKYWKMITMVRGTTIKGCGCNGGQ